MAEAGMLLTEGKGKRLYATDDPETAIVYFKDEAMAFHGLKRGRILGKGEVNNAVCGHIYAMLERHGVKTHFLKQLDGRQSLVKRVEIIPVCVKVRNRVAGGLAQRINLPTGMRLNPTVIEFCLKSEELEDPLVNFTHIRALGLATAEELEFISQTAARVNGILTDFLAEIGIELIDFKMEFGRYHGEIVVADEISPDTARFWDARTHEPLDIDRFRRDLGNVEQAYQEVLHRMMGMDE
ncbi:MAG: phosphoribosylaminoimidazolesuccinocarboxamide synthase [Christensenellaceae bacterium]|nr:phosphoribosylaminoimidazolesuccinocarboxamide synthase [Christensenellaceae bacterium]